jgi:hypothetical protein
LLSFSLLAACGELDPREEGPPDGIDSIQHALSTIDCTESKDTGYDDGKPFPITLVTVDGKKVEKATANAYYVMAKAAAAKGVNLKVVSGFRTMAEQTYFYNCYINCNCNNCNLAAKPGYSNHQSGHALDLNTSAAGVLTWLNNHAASYGFKRTVPSESWHWEWWGGGPGGGPCVDVPQFPVLTIKAAAVTIEGQERDFCQAEGSKGIFDLWSQQSVEINVDVKNEGTAVGRNVDVALWIEEPYLKAIGWTILSNWKSSGFVVNDTDGMQKVSRDEPGQSFKLWLASISPGETKRVTVKLRANGFSVGAADHPDLRAWVAHIDDYYEKTGWDAKPKNVDSRQKQNGGDLRDFVQTDVLDKESCDGKDNDCDGVVDGDEVCDGEEPQVDTTEPPPATSAEALPVAPVDAATSIGGCSLPVAPVNGSPLPLLVLFAGWGVLASVRSRRR